MQYHPGTNKRLNSVTYPFDDGTFPSYYIPASTDDIFNESSLTGAMVTDALNAIATDIQPRITNTQIDSLFVEVASNG